MSESPRTTLIILRYTQFYLACISYKPLRHLTFCELLSLSGNSTSSHVRLRDVFLSSEASQAPFITLQRCRNIYNARVAIAMFQLPQTTRPARVSSLLAKLPC
jgi:hypothetical protein